jgi:hypothetical protein
MDSTCQNNALNDVLKVADEKGWLINVYDRRFNDGLGKQWVENWKEDN